MAGSVEEWNIGGNNEIWDILCSSHLRSVSTAGSQDFNISPLTNVSDIVAGNWIFMFIGGQCSCKVSRLQREVGGEWEMTDLSWQGREDNHWSVITSLVPTSQAFLVLPLSSNQSLQVNKSSITVPGIYRWWDDGGHWSVRAGGQVDPSFIKIFVLLSGWPGCNS